MSGVMPDVRPPGGGPAAGAAGDAYDRESLERATGEGMPPPPPRATDVDPYDRVSKERATWEGMPPPPPGITDGAEPAAVRRASFWAERPEQAVAAAPGALRRQSRRDFLMFAAGTVAAATIAWWLLPDRTKARLLGRGGSDRLDGLAARIGLSRDRRERFLNRALTFDDDVAEALYSRNRRVRTYRTSDVTPLRNNYNGRTPGPEYLGDWTLTVSGLAGGRTERMSIDQLRARFPLRQQVTRLVCVEGWSAVAWWAGISFADFLTLYPPAPGARWASLRSAVNLDARGNSDPYYVSLDLETARHPQTLLGTHLNGDPLNVEHGAPLRLVAPMKLGLKNIKALTEIVYTAEEPRDYWNERGYSKYDGL